MRASHTHHVPHVGLPQIEPVTSATNVIAAPIPAQDFSTMSETLIFQIRLTAPAAAIR